MNEKFRILIICTAILFLCFVGTTSAETWYVDDDGGADFMKIQDAINNASVGDTIIVYSGVYYENVVVNKSVTLMGNGQPVIDAGGEGNAITLTEDGITLVGFTATNSVKDWRNVGIRVTSNNNTITGNDVSNNNNGDGIDLRDSSYNNISGNNVCNNNGDGIDLYDSNNNIIKGNNVCNNNGDGIYFGDSSYNTISGNNVCNNDDGIFFIFNYFGDSSYNTISGNNVCNNNDDGIYFGDSSYNTISGNNVCNNNYGGIGLDDSSYNTITGNNVSNNYGGIGLDDSSYNTITGNNVSNNEYSISLSDSNNNTITGNNVSNNEYGGIYLGDSSNNNSITGNTFVNNGLRVSNSYQNTVEGNIVNGKPLVYLEDVSDYKVEDAGQVILVNCSNITVENLDLSNTSVGIDLWETEASIISNNKVRNNSRNGICLTSSGNNTITGNNVSNNRYGLGLGDSSYNTITGNNVCNNNDDGIYFGDSSYNTISGNNVCNNNYGGIGLDDSSYNTITGNNVSNNNGDGIYLYDSSNHKIYLNNFINNTDNVYSSKSTFYYKKSTNIWNSTEEITYTYDGTTYKSYLGNYWSDYEGTDAEGDGIGDTHYSIDSEKDNYPLIERLENYSPQKVLTLTYKDFDELHEVCVYDKKWCINNICTYNPQRCPYADYEDKAISYGYMKKHNITAPEGSKELDVTVKVCCEGWGEGLAVDIDKLNPDSGIPIIVDDQVWGNQKWKK